MKIELHILNPEVQKQTDNKSDVAKTTWYTRTKSYESDYCLDEDMINSTVSHILDRLILNDVQITSKGQIDSWIEFLTKAKKSFQH